MKPSPLCFKAVASGPTPNIEDAPAYEPEHALLLGGPLAALSEEDIRWERRACIAVVALEDQPA
jgi:hypothetical protein